MDMAAHPAVPAMREFQDNLAYRVRPCLKTKPNKNHKQASKLKFIKCPYNYDLGMRGLPTKISFLPKH